MGENDLKTEILKIAEESLQRGPGFAQESVVLREAADRLRLAELDKQQALLTCWHDLFRDGVLSWGYDVDNPNAPFFHRTRR